VGALGIDHVSGQGFDDLRERGLHGVHVFQRRQVKIEALAAGALLRPAHLASAMTQVITTKFAAANGSRLA
jgi:hypothetical protein